jgi:ATP-dependent Clp protease ATP-binding subunit ClpA
MQQNGLPTGLAERLRALPDVLRQNILGQEEVISEAVALLRRSMLGVRLPDRPRASMLFCGGTGTGKTELCRLIARHLFGSLGKLGRIDMSECSQSGVGTLIGSSLNDRGMLGLCVQQTAGEGVLLFDEIEKADSLTLDLFLQILSAARVTLANGETLDLRNYIVIATSNLGSRVLMESKTMDRAMIVRRTLSSVLDYMRPEIYRRFELKCVFNRLGFETLQQIAELHLGKTLELLNAQGHDIRCSEEVASHVRRTGYSEEFGAGPIENAALDILGEVVSQEMLVNGGRPVRGTIMFDQPKRQCVLKL